MLDLTGIMFSSVMMLMVIVRALQLDSTQPWFQKVKLKTPPRTAVRTPWRRQNP